MVGLIIILFYSMALGLWISWRWFFIIYFFVHINMDYYLHNRQELLPKAKDRYYNGGGKEKAAKYYLENKDVLQENSKNKYKNVSEEEKN